MGESRKEALQVGFDGSVRLEFHGATVSSDGGLLAYRDLDNALGLTTMASAGLKDWRTGTNICHSMTALLRQSVYSRVAGYDVAKPGRECGEPRPPAGSRPASH